MPDPNLKGSELIGQLEDLQQELAHMADVMGPYREGRRAIALVITKLDEARLWLGEAIIEEPR